MRTAKRASHGRSAGLRADPCRHVAGEDPHGADVHVPERRTATLRAQVAALDALRAELETRGTAVKGGFLGLPASGDR